MFSAALSTCKPGYESYWPRCSLELFNWEPLGGDLRALGPVADPELTPLP